MSADRDDNQDSGNLVVTLAARANAGDQDARNALFSALYDELHRIAQAQINRNTGPITLSASTLLHEAYLDIAKRNALAFPDRNRFLGYASRAMRGLVMDYVRRRMAHKRGGQITFTTLADDEAGAAPPPVDLERLDAALTELANVDDELAKLVELKFFCGFSFVEIAAMRGVSERTVQRDWAKARMLLHQHLTDEEP